MNKPESAIRSSGSPQPPTFYEKHSAALRIWHWCFFLLLTTTMAVVLLASTTFRTGHNIAMVQQQLQKGGITTGTNQARAVSHAFNDKLWLLHTWIGYIIAIFLLGRLLLEIAQPSDEKLATRIRRALGFKPSAPAEQQQKQHYIRVKQGYLIFYTLILIMAITGLGLAFDHNPFLKSIHSGLKQLHSITQYGIYGFVFLHLAGVVLAETGAFPGLVSAMINGKKRP